MYVIISGSLKEVKDIWVNYTISMFPLKNLGRKVIKNVTCLLCCIVSFFILLHVNTETAINKKKAPIKLTKKGNRMVFA